MQLMRVVVVSVMLWVMAPVTAAPALGATAQPQRTISARAKMSSRQVYVGEPATLTIEVQNSDHAEAPALPASKDFSIQYVSEGNTSQQFLITINGRSEDRSTRSYTFQYAVTPGRAGRITIPSLSVRVDGETYRTEPIELSVVEPVTATGSKLVMELEKPAAYVGEPIRMTLTWYLDADARGPSISIPLPDSVQMLTPAAWEPGNARAATGEKLAEVMLNSQRVIGVVASGMLNNRSCTTFRIQRIVMAGEAGSLSLGPSRVTYQVAVGQRRSTFIDSPFDDLNTYERRVVASEPVALTVRALPQPAPAGFSGLVGNFTIDVAATPTILSVGDPFTLSVRVGGPEPLDRVPPLDLSEQPGFPGSFKLPAEPSLPNVLPTAAIFSIDLRPTSERVKQVPALEIPYFDVSRGEYAVARSKPIPLMVRPTAEVTLDDEPPAGDAAPAAPAEERPVDPNAPPPLVHDPTLLTRPLLTFGQFVSTPAGAAVSIAPIGVYALAWAAAARRRRHERDPGRRRRRRALRRSLRRIRQASGRPHAEGPVAAAMRGFVADSLDVPEEGVTSAEVAAYFRDRHPAVHAEAEELLRHCDRAQYAGDSPEAARGSEGAELAERARSLLRRAGEEPAGANGPLANSAGGAPAATDRA